MGQLSTANWRFSSTKRLGLSEFHAKDLANPVRTREGIVLPNAVDRGFSLLLSSESKKDSFAWTCKLQSVPAFSATPVVVGQDLYTCVMSNDLGALLFVRIPADTGEPDFLEMIEDDRTAVGQAPLAVSDSQGAAIVWPLERGLALMRVQLGNRRPEQKQGRHIIVAQCAGLSAGERLLSPVKYNDDIVCVTTMGKVFGIKWSAPGGALRLQGARELARLPGEWMCGPPISVQNLGVAFLAVDRDNRNSLHLVVFRDGHIETKIVSDGSGVPEFASSKDEILRRRPIFDGTTCLIPSAHLAGVYQYAASLNGKGPILSWIPGDRRLDTARFAVSFDFLAFLAGGELITYRDMHTKRRLEPNSIQPLIRDDHPLRPVADPILCADQMFVLCTDYLIGIPIIRA
jgi:hypothetical protein